MQRTTIVIGASHGSGRRRLAVRAVACVAGAVALAAILLAAQQPTGSTEQRRLTTANGAVVRSPHVHAVQVLEQRQIGVAPRVRFEWEQLRGAREYVLAGRWTGTIAWTVQTNEYRITPRSATRWTPSHVVFETRLPEGSHSWKLLAVFGPNDTREVGEPSLLSFAVH